MASSHQHGGAGGYQAVAHTAYSSSSSSSSAHAAAMYHHRAPEQLQFTAEMRDRQARGKDPYEESGDSDDGCYHRIRRKDESFTITERRRHAASILDCPELLMIYAQRDGDSIPATRLRFTRMLCGKEPDSPRSSRKKNSSSHRTSTGGSSGRTSDRVSVR